MKTLLTWTLCLACAGTACTFDGTLPTDAGDAYDAEVSDTPDLDIGGDVPSTDATDATDATAQCATHDDCRDALCALGRCEAGTCVLEAQTDGSPCEDGVCEDGVCASIAICGDGRLHADEACDDGNLFRWDGCSPECEIERAGECDTDLDCDVGDPCSEHLCDDVGRCVQTEARDGGELCLVNGECWDGHCFPVTCGDGRVEGTEACDGQPGCTDFCQWECEVDGDCDDGDPCAGHVCDNHACVIAEAEPIGAFCGVDLACDGEHCVTAICGNGVLEPGEVCDGEPGCTDECDWECVVDADCGADVCAPEICVSHQCVPTTAPDCDDRSACTVDACVPGIGCVNELVDGDGDGHAPAELGACGTDCDDRDALTFSGADEVCDELDNDCDGAADETAPGATPWYVDCDGDGAAPNTYRSTIACEEPSVPPAPSAPLVPAGCLGWTDNPPEELASDCWDTDPAIGPHAGYATERNSRGSWDYNCNGQVDARYTETGVSVWDRCEPRGLSCDGVQGWSDAVVPNCGQSAEFVICAPSGGHCTRSRVTRTQACR